MSHSSSRRQFLLAMASVPLLTVRTSRALDRHDDLQARSQLEHLEREFGGRLGVFALNTSTGVWLGHRADEKFPVCSTFKVIAASAILSRSAHSPELLQRRIKYGQGNPAPNSPITQKHLADGMTVAELCAAAIQYSDNTAANLLLRMLGGPAFVTAFARSVGDREFRLDRWETALNSAIPGDPRDTSTPEAMGRTLQRLVVGDALAPQHREQLRAWLKGSTTGKSRIKAGLPAQWQIGDKTGTGSFGTANDLAIVWPPRRKPVIISIYTTQHQKEAKPSNDVIASATRAVVRWLGTN